MSYAAYSSMMLDHTVDKIRELNRERDARINALKSREDAENYVKDVRAKIAGIFDIPQDRPVPESQLCGTIVKDDFKVEKIIYYSRENFPVTSNLYLPLADGKHPGVIFLCGHSGTGKLGEAYQAAASNLARKGYAVLVIDPIGQGERWQYVNVPGAESVSGSCTYEHSMLGKQLRLCGDYFGAWRAYDAICGLDYLLSRPEVDPARIGVTGNSGGGTMTSFVQALDSRFTMAAPSCYMTSWQRNFENEVVVDSEQMIPGILSAGCEMGDLILAYAPRPVILLGQKQDFFDERGLRETYARAKKVYELLGAGDNLQYFIGPTYHGYSIENRCAMYRFFNHHAGMDGDDREAENRAALSTKELNCTESGQILTSMPDAWSVRDFIRKETARLQQARQALSVEELQALLRKMLQLPEKFDLPYVRMLRTLYFKEGEKYRIHSRFGIETEAGIMTTLKIICGTAYSSLPAFDELDIYLPHLDSASELLAMKFPLEKTVAGYDCRNVGESRAHTCYSVKEYDYFQTFHGQDYHYDGIGDMFGRSTVAQRVYDLLSAIAYVKSCGVKKLTLSARGLGCVPAVIAALLSEDVEALTLYDAPESWRSMADKTVTIWPQSCMIPGILKYTDLPEIYAAVKQNKALEIINFADEPVSEV